MLLLFNGCVTADAVFGARAAAAGCAHAVMSLATMLISALAGLRVLGCKGHYRAPPRPRWGRSIHASPQ